MVQTEDGRVVDIDRVETRDGDFTVYNFRVDGFPTYFISELGVLVHNACDPTSVPGGTWHFRPDRDLDWRGRGGNEH